MARTPLTMTEQEQAEERMRRVQQAIVDIFHIFERSDYDATESKFLNLLLQEFALRCESDQMRVCYTNHTKALQHDSIRTSQGDHRSCR